MKRDEIKEFYPGLGTGIVVIRELLKRYAGTQTMLIFNDREHSDLYMFMFTKKMKAKEVESMAEVVERETGGRAMFIHYANVYNAPTFFNQFRNAYVVSWNYFIDHIWGMA